jgi:hypothetical protein
MNRSTSSLTPFQREVASRFGLVPNFFVSAPDAPEIIEKLWDFAKSGYLDNPAPLSMPPTLDRGWPEDFAS